MTTGVSVIIRVRNEGEALARLMEELRKQRFSGSLEIIVIDNQSDDDSKDVAVAAGAKVYSLPRELFTYGRAINLGIARASNPMVVLLSAHAWPTSSDWLQSMVDRLGSSEETMGVYCKQVPGEEIGYRQGLRFSYFSRPSCVIDKQLITRRLAAGESLYVASYFSNSAAILRKSAAQRFLMQDLPYAEENAFALDCILAGMQVVYAEDISVVYRGPVSAKGLYHQARRQMIAEKLIEQAYAGSFDNQYNYLKVNIRSAADVMLIPLHLVRLARMTMSSAQSGLGPRALLYEKCALAGIFGRFIGACSWRRYRDTLGCDELALRNASEAMKLTD